MTEMKQLRYAADVFKDTMKMIEIKYKDNTDDLVKNRIHVYTEPISDLQIMPHPTMPRDDMTTFVVNMGTVTAGRKLVESTGKRTAILNFADAIRPGGYVLEGAPTQEENICRCSNLYPALVSELAFDKYYWVNFNNLYPLDNIYGIEISHAEDMTWKDLQVLPGIYTNRLIYTRDVLFFRDDTEYMEEEPIAMDVITCPAPNVDWKDEEWAYKIIVSRAEQIIKSAILNKVENLVLGAWGCGAFAQNPEIVSKAFTEVIKKYRAFSNVTYAIRCTSDSWLDNNYNIFLKNCR